MRKTWILLVLILAAIACCDFCCGCGGSSPPPSPPPGGFYVDTVLVNAVAEAPEPDTLVEGTDIEDYAGVVGTAFSFPSTTTGLYARLYVSGGRVPARWQFTELSGACIYESTTVGVFDVNSTVTLWCGALVTGYTMSPTLIYTDIPPATATITGEAGSFDPTYGMPLTQYYDSTGTLQGQAYATSVASDGSSITGPVPDLSSAPSGMYTGVVLNAGSNNTVIQVGAATTEVITGCP